jgi:hypothetical protein
MSDWLKSSARLLLLSRFLTPREIGKRDFLSGFHWEEGAEALGESPRKTIERFLAEGLLEQADLAERIGCKFKVNDLKTVAKQHSLPVSGRKDDLIARLIQADPAGIKEALADCTVLRCSERGRTISEQYLAEEREKRAIAERHVLEALSNRQFIKAVQTMAAFEAKQVFLRGLVAMGRKSWEDYDPTRDAETLSHIFHVKPKVLASLSDEQRLEHLRMATAIRYLWGRGYKEYPLPEDTGQVIKNHFATRMIMIAAHFYTRLAEFRQTGVTSVQVYNCNDHFVCSACHVLAEQEHKLDEMPELPYEKCTSELGCRCGIGIGGSFFNARQSPS